MERNEKGKRVRKDRKRSEDREKSRTPLSPQKMQKGFALGGSKVGGREQA